MEYNVLFSWYLFFRHNNDTCIVISNAEHIDLPHNHEKSLSASLHCMQKVLSCWKRQTFWWNSVTHVFFKVDSNCNSNKTRYVDGTPTSEVTIPVHPPPMVTQVNIMVMNGWLTSFLFHVINQPPHSWDKAISNSDLETPRSRSWVWAKGKVIQSAQYHIDSLPFHFTSIRPTIPEIELFQNLTLKYSRSRSMSHIVPSIQPMYFLFISHQSDQPFLRYGQNGFWPWKNTSEIFKQNLPK